MLTASRIVAALSHRSWVFEGQPRGHLFLLSCGQARLAGPLAGETELSAPALLFLPPASRGVLQVLAGGEGFVATIEPEALQRTAGDPALTLHLRPLLDRVVLAGPDMLTPRLATVAASFAALVEEARASLPAAGPMAVLHLAILLLQLWRCGSATPSGGQRAGSQTTVQRFRQLVELHYREGLRIDQFAARLGVTRAHLHDACGRVAGRTPLALLHDRLLAEARARLEQTDLSVEQVGYGLGFRDPAYFNRFFKRMTGVSPGAFRRRAAASRSAPAAPSFAAWP